MTLTRENQQAICDLVRDFTRFAISLEHLAMGGKYEALLDVLNQDWHHYKEAAGLGEIVHILSAARKNELP